MTWVIRKLLHRLFISPISPNLIVYPRSQMTSFHLNWVRCDWSQSRQTGSLDSARPSSPLLWPTAAQRSVQMKWGHLRWGEISYMNDPLRTGDQWSLLSLSISLQHWPWGWKVKGKGHGYWHESASERVSSFSTAHQHMIGYSVPWSCCSFKSWNG